jgi:DNA-binding response OmpR family regulator
VYQSTAHLNINCHLIQYAQMSIPSKTVLVVDDDDGILEVVRIILEQQNHTVITLNNGKEVLAMVNTHQPDLILLDIWLGGTSGQQILFDIKDKEWGKKIPVLMMSALSETKNISRDGGADGFIEKPFDIDYLARQVNSFLK